MVLDGVEDVLARDIEYIDGLLSVKDGVREEAIRVTRSILRNSTEAVRLIHLGRLEDAWRNISEASRLVGDLKNILRDHPDLYYSGLVYNALSEYVEAYITYMLISEKRLPSIRELDTPYIPYLQGLGDCVGELRRHILMLLNRDMIDEAEEYLDIMEKIYLYLRKLNYPDALTPGLRHKVDVARRLVEDTRVLLINTRNALRVSKLMDKLLGRINED